MVEVVGFEPTTYSVQTSRSSQLELYPHILQNISRANYLHSAETLLSWSAEPHLIPYSWTMSSNRKLPFASIKSIKLHTLLYTEFLSCPKRVASSRSKANNQKTVKHNTLQPNRNNSITTGGDTCQQESHLIRYTLSVSVTRAYLFLLNRAKSTYAKD